MDNVFDMIRAENLAELKAKDAVIAEKNAEIADKEAEIAGKEAEIASVKAENARHMAGLICTLRLQLQNFTDGSVPADIDARIKPCRNQVIRIPCGAGFSLRFSIPAKRTF